MPERKTLNRTYSVGDQVPTCPVFTRAKIKSRFGKLVDLPSQKQEPPTRIETLNTEKQEPPTRIETLNTEKTNIIDPNITK